MSPNIDFDGPAPERRVSSFSFCIMRASVSELVRNVNEELLLSAYAGLRYWKY